MTRIFEPNVKIPNPHTGKADSVTSTRSNKAGTPNLAPTGEDQVYTDSQNQLQALASAVGDQAHAQRVEDLRALVQSGQYRIDANALSGAIVDAMLRGY